MTVREELSLRRRYGSDLRDHRRLELLRLAYLRNRQPDGGRELWVADADGNNARLVGTSLIAPTWSPDGTLLIAEGTDGLVTILPDGTDQTPLAPGLRTERSLDPWTGASDDLYAGAYLGPSWQRIAANE